MVVIIVSGDTWTTPDDVSTILGVDIVAAVATKDGVPA